MSRLPMPSRTPAGSLRGSEPFPPTHPQPHDATGQVRGVRQRPRAHIRRDGPPAASPDDGIWESRGPGVGYGVAISDVRADTRSVFCLASHRIASHRTRRARRASRLVSAHALHQPGSQRVGASPPSTRPTSGLPLRQRGDEPERRTREGCRVDEAGRGHAACASCGTRTRSDWGAMVAVNAVASPKPSPSSSISSGRLSSTRSFVPLT